MQVDGLIFSQNVDVIMEKHPQTIPKQNLKNV
jgi:hypothetical protein